MKSSEASEPNNSAKSSESDSESVSKFNEKGASTAGVSSRRSPKLISSSLPSAKRSSKSVKSNPGESFSSNSLSANRSKSSEDEFKSNSKSLSNNPGSLFRESSGSKASISKSSSGSSLSSLSRRPANKSSFAAGTSRLDGSSLPPNIKSNSVRSSSLSAAANRLLESKASSSEVGVSEPKSSLSNSASKFRGNSASRLGSDRFQKSSVMERSAVSRSGVVRERASKLFGVAGSSGRPKSRSAKSPNGSSAKTPRSFWLADSRRGAGGDSSTSKFSHGSEIAATGVGSSSNKLSRSKSSKLKSSSSSVELEVAIESLKDSSKLKSSSSSANRSLRSLNGVASLSVGDEAAPKKSSEVSLAKLSSPRLSRLKLSKRSSVEEVDRSSGILKSNRSKSSSSKVASKKGVGSEFTSGLDNSSKRSSPNRLVRSSSVLSALAGVAESNSKSEKSVLSSPSAVPVKPNVEDSALPITSSSCQVAPRSGISPSNKSAKLLSSAMPISGPLRSTDPDGSESSTKRLSVPDSNKAASRFKSSNSKLSRGLVSAAKSTPDRSRSSSASRRSVMAKKSARSSSTANGNAASIGTRAISCSLGATSTTRSAKINSWACFRSLITIGAKAR